MKVVKRYSPYASTLPKIHYGANYAICGQRNPRLLFRYATNTITCKKCQKIIEKKRLWDTPETGLRW